MAETPKRTRFAKSLSRAGKSFAGGAKASPAWDLGLKPIAELGGGNKIDLSTKNEKRRNLAKNLASSAAGFGAFSAAENTTHRKMRSIKALRSIHAERKARWNPFEYSKTVGRDVSGRRSVSASRNYMLASKRSLKSVAKYAPALAAGVGAAMLADKLMGKFTGKREGLVVPLGKSR